MPKSKVMPIKKKKTGHTDYRTGGMFYSKYNKGGVSVAGVQEHKVDRAGYEAAERHANKLKADIRRMIELDPLGRDPSEWTESERRALRAAAGLTKNIPRPPDNALPFLRHTRFDPDRK
tara:strand:+ start:544 stop:900 length:357 start_codon:yes stop_codon:yes gene_type:complete